MVSKAASAIVALALLAATSVHAFAPLRTIAHPRSMPVSKASPAPTVERIENSQVKINIPISGEDTLAFFEIAAEDFSKRTEIRGFRKGSKIPTNVVVNFVGAEAIKSKALQDISDKAIARAVATAGVKLVGQPQFTNGEDALIGEYNPGEPIDIPVVCDIWPELTWLNEEGPYEGIVAEVVREPVDEGKIAKSLENLRLRYIKNQDTAEGYTAELGDCVIGDMMGFIANDDGSKGQALPQVASGDNLEIILEEGRFMPGLVEGLMGAKAGDVKEISVSFPNMASSKSLPQELAGKPAIFEITVHEVKNRVLPELNDEFAASIRDDLTFAELENEVRTAVTQERDDKTVDQRNRMVELQLYERVKVDIPDTLVTEQAREKFAMMMADFREQGTPDEEIKKMITPEGFTKYKDIAREGICKTLGAALAVNDIAAAEGIQVDPADVEDQLAMLKAQAEQQGDNDFDAGSVKGKIEAQMQRDQVIDFLVAEGKATIKYVDKSMAEIEAELDADAEAMEAEAAQNAEIVD